MMKQVNVESDNLEEAVGNHFHRCWHNDVFLKKFQTKQIPRDREMMRRNRIL